MDASSKLQLNVLMQNFKELKTKHTQLQHDHDDLVILYEKQKERIITLASQRCQLITLFKNTISKFNAEKESLQKENSNLHAANQEQSILIEEHATIIDQLKKDITIFKPKKQTNNVIDRGIKQSDQIRHRTNSNGTFKNKFSHPSFDTTPTEPIKKKKKTPLVLQNRYSNLNITGSVLPKKKGSPDSNATTSSSKKRRLFSLEDDMIDLTSNED